MSLGKHLFASNRAFAAPESHPAFNHPVISFAAEPGRVPLIIDLRDGFGRQFLKSGCGIGCVFKELSKNKLLKIQ